jgi:hypothetical protein
MTTMSATSTPQTAQLLVALYQYVASYARSHPVLLPAVVGLRDAAQLYGRNDAQRVFQKGVEVYQFLVRVTRCTSDCFS